MKLSHIHILRILVFVACGVAGVALYLNWSASILPAKAEETIPLQSENTENWRYEPTPIGDPPTGHPMITYVTVGDLDQDGLPDVIACDGVTNSVRWLRQFPRGVFTEQQVGSTILGPVHAELCDINGDGKIDILVASMGEILPNNNKIGSVVVLENLGGGKFENHVIIDQVYRVTDVRGVDINHDGKIDLVVGQFGYVEGGIQWLENLGNWHFRSHPLLNQPGTIHTPVDDFDHDGNPDFAALVSQDSEAIHLYSGDGRGEFQDLVLWQAGNPDWASSGLIAADLNRDGRPDLIYSNGDGFDGNIDVPVWHGIQWLENRGGRSFVYHRIADFPGCYSPVCVDLNGDGNNDIVAVSAYNDWRNPQAVSMMAWLNDGRQNFRPVVLARAPTHLICLAAGDLNGDGKPELITGAFYTYPPYTEMSRITLWSQRAK